MLILLQSHCCERVLLLYCDFPTVVDRQADLDLNHLINNLIVHYYKTLLGAKKEERKYNNR